MDKANMWVMWPAEHRNEEIDSINRLLWSIFYPVHLKNGTATRNCYYKYDSETCNYQDDFNCALKL